MSGASLYMKLQDHPDVRLLILREVMTSEVTGF